MNIRNNIRRFLKSFTYAGCGIWECISTQRNMRFHTGAAIAVAALAVICDVNGSEALALLLTVGGVFALECVNTAVENAVDLTCKGELSDKAKAAKDCAAGAVLVYCLAAIGVGVSIFGTRLGDIFAFFKNRPAFIAAAAGYAALWFWWVFVCFGKTDENKNKGQ